MTTLPLRPAAWAPLEAALRQRHPVTISYHGLQRIVCVHALGWNNARPILLGYQVGGQTSTGTLDPDPRKRWRCMYIDEIDHVHADGTTQWASADNYNPSRPFNAIDHVALSIPCDHHQNAIS
jgi:hypothetical protein